MNEVLVTHEDFRFKTALADSVRFSDIRFPQSVTRVQLTVTSVYPGNEFKNLAISAIFGFTPAREKSVSNKALIEKYGKKPRQEKT